MRCDGLIARGIAQVRQVNARKRQLQALQHGQALAVRGDVRAQRIVPVDQLLERAVQRAHIQRPLQSQRNRLVERQRSLTAQLVGEPDFALRFGRWHDHGQLTPGEGVVVHGLERARRHERCSVHVPTLSNLFESPAGLVRISDEPRWTPIGFVPKACAGHHRLRSVHHSAHGATRQESRVLQFQYRAAERLDDVAALRVPMRGGQEAGEIVEHVDAAAAHHREQQVLERMLLEERRFPHGCEVVHQDRSTHLRAEGVDLLDHRRRARVQALLQRGPLALQRFQHRLCGCQHQRVPHERTCEIGDAHRGHGFVAELPCPAIERIHVFALARNDPDRIAAADHLAVCGDIGLDAKQGLGTAGMRAEAGHHLVENQDGTRGAGDLTHFLEELHRTQVGVAALHGFDQHAGQLMRAFADDLQGLGRAVVEHQHMLRRVPEDARCGGHGTQLPRSTHEHFIVDAVIRAVEQHDRLAPGDGARDPHRSEHGLRSRVA